MCAVRSLFRLLLISFFLASALGSYAQVTISETDSPKLEANLLEVRSILLNSRKSINEREKELSKKESSLQQREIDLDKREASLNTREAGLEKKDQIIAAQSTSLTIACQSLSEADQAAIKLKAENRLWKIGGVAGWVAALIAAGFLVFN